jgi:hypothetical protein
MKRQTKAAVRQVSATSTPTAEKAQAEPAKILTVRLSDDWPQRLEDARKLVNMEKSDLARIGVEAVIKLIERDKQLTIPLRLIAVPMPTPTAQI